MSNFTRYPEGDGNHVGIAARLTRKIMTALSADIALWTRVSPEVAGPEGAEHDGVNSTMPACIQHEERETVMQANEMEFVSRSKGAFKAR
jgi:hypothetical protein